RRLRGSGRRRRALRGRRRCDPEGSESSRRLGCAGGSWWRLAPGDLAEGGTLVGDDGVADLGAGRLDGGEGQGLDDPAGEIQGTVRSWLREGGREVVIGLVAGVPQAVKLATGLLQTRLGAVLEAEGEIFVRGIRLGHCKSQVAEQVARGMERRV